MTTPSAHPEIPAQATADLGINVHMEGLDSASLLHRVLNDPYSFDLVQLEYWMAPHALAAGCLQGIPVRALSHLNDVMPLFTQGTVAGRAVAQQGTAPHSVQFLDHATSRAAGPSARDFLSLAPTVCNADGLGWRSDRVAQPVSSWGSLLSSDLQGRVALSQIASVSVVEAALACEALSLATYRDKGNLSRNEIDATLGVLLEAARDGQFHGTWRTFEESVHFMTRGPVALQSMWPPAVSSLRRQGIPLRYAPLREGARGWAGGFALASHLDTYRKDAALDYINWYHSGWAGARLTRQGYYSAVPATARRHLTSDEWDYWYEGNPATASILGPTGEVTDAIGSVREGGSYETRMGQICVWTSRVVEHAYLARQWANFLQVSAPYMACQLHA